MPALDLIRPSVTAMRVIASVNDGSRVSLNYRHIYVASVSSRQTLMT
ncbi:ethanolamine utilization protein [Citrobacter koseri]|nr:ethanolamine utilization protein [Citrobacter koseri]